MFLLKITLVHWSPGSGWEQGVDPHVNILGGTAYVSGLDIDYHH
jgi:hypothetical protein